MSKFIKFILLFLAVGVAFSLLSIDVYASKVNGNDINLNEGPDGAGAILYPDGTCDGCYADNGQNGRPMNRSTAAETGQNRPTPTTETSNAEDE